MRRTNVSRPDAPARKSKRSLIVEEIRKCRKSKPCGRCCANSSIATRPRSRSRTCAAFDGWGESYPLPEGAATEPKTLGGIGALKVSALRSRADRALLYMHGGGYAIGSIKSHRHLVAQLCEASGFVGYALDYRLAPETVFPGAVDDAVSAYRALLESKISAENRHRRRFGRRRLDGGDSAGVEGARLASARWPVLHFPMGGSFADRRELRCQRRARSHRRPDGARPMGRALSFRTEAKNPLASPVHGDFSGLAPMLIHVGSDEVLLSDSTRLAEAAGMARVPVELLIAPDMPHVWHFMWAQLAPAREAIARRGRVDEILRGMRRRARGQTRPGELNWPTQHRFRVFRRANDPRLWSFLARNRRGTVNEVPKERNAMNRSELLGAVGGMGAGMTLGGAHVFAHSHGKTADHEMMAPLGNHHLHFCGIHCAKKDPLGHRELIALAVGRHLPRGSQSGHPAERG